MKHILVEIHSYNTYIQNDDEDPHHHHHHHPYICDDLMSYVIVLINVYFLPLNKQNVY